ncbi:oxidoreductase [Pedobacter sp. BS3]|uniref:Gfo/Idh/MocA family oxidoreductase n=1 Tax=Pedobacter sp. BS3 TaxID=2567937 RepID=UPI0011ECC30B|nr:Gfo/Idh/MocA family oxidoreductase [Pedobacter sp. BS3]TZF83557.1 oxidoreductase [Pedobacter sp. BS3]
MSQQKINTVILGYGFSGSVFFAPFLDLHPGFQLIGALERSKKKIQNDYPYTRSYTTLEEILADSEVELVVVNTPIGTHYELAKQVLEAGKSAIVEKAFTNTAAQAKELDDLAKAKKLKLYVYQNRRFDSDFLTVEKVIKSGKLGEIKEATLSYDIYLPEIRGAFHTEEKLSGGEFNNRGSHVTDQAVKLFGLPEKVFADFAAFRPHSPVEDYFEAILYYPDKRVKIRGTDISLSNQPGYIIHGTKGSFLKSRSDIQEERLLKGEKPKSTSWSLEDASEQGTLTYMENGQKISETIPTEDGNYYNYFEAVFQNFRNSKPSPMTGFEGYQNMLVMDAVRKSVEEGKIIYLKNQ